MPFDRFDECFLKITPPKNYTFSHQALPCRFEPPLIQRTKADKLTCPYLKNGYCKRIIDSSDLQQRLVRAYSERIKSTLAEPSTSVVVRSEQQFHGMDRQRFAQRRHLYEVVKNGTPRDISRFGIDCTELNQNDRLGEYLGFIDLRQHYNTAPLALGFLVEPSHMREDPNTFVITGKYAALFGGPPAFRSTVYSMQDHEDEEAGRPATIGAKCAQMCAIMTLGMLSDRKAEIKGSYTLTYMAWLLKQAGASKKADNKSGRMATDVLKRRYKKAADRVDMRANPAPLAHFHAEGLYPYQLRDVLKVCNASSAWYEIDCEPSPHENVCHVSDRLVTRLIEAYVYARYPVILAVDSLKWQRKEPFPEEQERLGHAATVVGIRREPEQNEPRSFIVHDPGDMPFRERTVPSCLCAMRAYRRDNTYSLIVAAEWSIKQHACECVRWLTSDPFESIEFSDYYFCISDTNYRIILLNRNSMLRVLLPQVVRQRELCSELRKWLTLPLSRYWCICGYLNGQLKSVWLFNASSDGGGCDAKMSIEGDEIKAYRYFNGVTYWNTFRFRQ